MKELTRLGEKNFNIFLCNYLFIYFEMRYLFRLALQDLILLRPEETAEIKSIIQEVYKDELYENQVDGICFDLNYD